jgi:hypothetical protein
LRLQNISYRTIKKKAIVDDPTLIAWLLPSSISFMTAADEARSLPRYWNYAYAVSGAFAESTSLRHPVRMRTYNAAVCGSQPVGRKKRVEGRSEEKKY